MASHFAIQYAAHQIRHGGIIVYPTETVYGLGCDPMNYDAITDLNQLKQREPGKGLILLAHTLALFNDYIEELSSSDKLTIEKTEKPTSWVVRAKDSLPDWLTNKQGTLAIRITQHPVVVELCQQLNHPIVSTSANRANEEAARTSEQVKQIFNNEIDLVLEGETNLNAQPSEIRDALTNNVIRSQ